MSFLQSLPADYRLQYISARVPQWARDQLQAGPRSMSLNVREVMVAWLNLPQALRADLQAKHIDLLESQAARSAAH